MTTSAISTTPAASPGEIVYAGANTNAGKTTLDSADFMKLMIAQLTAQDPMNPMKDTEFISQMANFTSLENSRTLSESFKNFTTQQSLSSAPNYLGKYATVKDAAQGEITGLVEGVVLDETKPSVVIGGQRYEIKLITAVSNQAPALTAALAAAAPSIPTTQDPATPAPATPPAT